MPRLPKRASPSRTTLPWGDLQLLGVVAEARTLPAAATRLGLDHSTVFRRLRQVESALGTPVFERTPQGYVPTAAASELVALAGRTTEQLGAALRRLSGQTAEPEGEVRIATSDALLCDLLMPLLAAFTAACPLVRLDVVTGNVPHNLSRRDADVAIRATAAPPDTLVGRKVARIAWAPYAARTLVDGQDPATLLSDGPWVGFGDAMAGLAGAIRLRTLPPDRIASRFDTVSGIRAAILAGLGIGLLPCFAGDGNAALVRLSAPDPALSTDLWLLTHPDLRHAPRIRLLLDDLAARLLALRSRIEGLDPDTERDAGLPSMPGGAFKN